MTAIFAQDLPPTCQISVVVDNQDPGFTTNGGWWKGRRLISDEWLRSHHGGNDSFVGGESAHYTAIGKVVARGMPYPLPEELFGGPVRRT